MILIVSVVINSEKICIWNNERMILSNNNINKVEITIHITNKYWNNVNKCSLNLLTFRFFMKNSVVCFYPGQRMK